MALNRTQLLNLIPSPESFEAVRGFASFYGSGSPISRTSPPARYSQNVSRTLAANRSHLSQLRTRAVNRRKTEYDGYIASSIRYSKLLELNNTRSKILTSLSKKVGEVKVTTLDQRRLEDIYYEVHETRLELPGWKPQAREGQVCLVYRDWIVLVGGHNNSPLDTICFYAMGAREWVRSKCVESDLRRTYHSGVLYKHHYVILFGGMSSYNPYYKTRECLNTCGLLALNSTPPALKRIKISNENTIEARRCHSAVIVGKHMLVFGGVNTKKEYLNDLKVLDLKELRWDSKEYKVESQDLDAFLQFGLAKHFAFAHFADRESYPLYSKAYDDKEGVYVFGGTNQLGAENLLLHLSLKWRTPRLSKVYPSGFPPSCLNPAVAQYSKDTVVIISGERQEREICLYRIQENEFVALKNTPRSLGGVGSSLVHNMGCLYLLFGLGDEGYIGSVTELRVREKYKEKAWRRKPAINTDENRQSKFFADYSEGMDLP